MINGVKVYPVVYMGLCESLGYDGGWSDVDPLKIITNILSIKKPKPQAYHLPSKPERTYKDGWKGWGDFQVKRSEN